MTHRDSQQTGRLRLRHLMERSEATGELMAEQRERFARLKDPASAPAVVCAFNLFQTPPELADRVAVLADLAGLNDDARILEPSAGLGRLYRAIRHRTAAAVVLVEISPDCCRELYRETAGDSAVQLVKGDFLTVDGLGLFDRIVMNPPFKNGSDCKHIERAAGLLAPGGRLVSICADGPKRRALCERLGGTWHDLPAGSFASEGTRVAAGVIVIDQ